MKRKPVLRAGLGFLMAAVPPLPFPPLRPMGLRRQPPFLQLLLPHFFFHPEAIPTRQALLAPLSPSRRPALLPRLHRRLLLPPFLSPHRLLLVLTRHRHRHPPPPPLPQRRRRAEEEEEKVRERAERRGPPAVLVVLTSLHVGVVLGVGALTRLP